MKLPEPQAKTFTTLISDIEKGQIKIPQFQRDFVWTIQKSAGLIDSIVKGYPIGTFIFWRTKDRLRSVRNLGNLYLPEPEVGESVDYVLDGQQRLTSLFACLKGVTIKRDGSANDDFSKIFLNLKAKENEKIVTCDMSQYDPETHISILDLLKGDFTVLASYPKELHDNLKLYKNRIESYQYPIIQIKDAPIDIATEIFTRINVGGKPLSVFEIMVAKTFDYERDFDLSEKYKELIDRLTPLDYETLSDATVLQAVSTILSKECKRQAILGLDKNKFIDVWDSAIDAIERTVEYFKSYYRIPVSQLLPYNALIVPFSYFFYHHKDKPTGTKKEYLEDFFWRCSLGGRYSYSLESKLANDIKKIEDILNGRLPAYDWPIDTSAKFILDNGAFSAGRSYVKAILCIYAHSQPKSFIDDSIVNISNNWLKQANSKNYHHFFPKSYLKNKSIHSDHYINHILNITIVDDFLNKREIGAKAPSVYMKKFAEVNSHLNQTMTSHLIECLDSYGVWSDNFDLFLKKRAETVSEAIQKRIIKQDVDSSGQLVLVNDYEEDVAVYE